MAKQFSNRISQIVFAYITSTPMTFEEYKEKTGIDLDEFIKDIEIDSSSYAFVNHPVRVHGIFANEDYSQYGFEFQAGKIYDYELNLIIGRLSYSDSLNRLVFSLQTFGPTINMYIFITDRKIFGASTLPTT